MEYEKLSYKEKISRLLEVLHYSTALAEAIGVSRRTLLNWDERPDSIRPEHQLDIDVLYCKHFVIPEWDAPRQTFSPVLLPDNLAKNEALLLPFLRSVSFGTLEIETGITREEFDRALDASRLPKNLSRQLFQESVNAFFTHQWLWQRIVGQGEPLVITDETIRHLHDGFMRGVHEGAGFYSGKIRVMGKLPGVDTTLPEDIPEEVNRWVFKCARASTLEEIARAHAWFIAIHPFGDGNGRTGRALVMAQCLNARLMPPVFNGGNRAIYYAAMEHAMRHGRHAPLVRLFHEAARGGL